MTVCCKPLHSFCLMVHLCALLLALQFGGYDSSIESTIFISDACVGGPGWDLRRMNHVYLVVRPFVCGQSSLHRRSCAFFKAISQILTQRLPPSLSRPCHRKSVRIGKHLDNVSLKTAEQISWSQVWELSLNASLSHSGLMGIPNANRTRCQWTKWRRWMPARPVRDCA